MRLENEEEGAFSDLWNISKNILTGSEGTAAMKAAVHRLSTTLQAGKSWELKKELEDNGCNERKHMLTLQQQWYSGSEPTIVHKEVTYFKYKPTMYAFLHL